MVDGMICGMRIMRLSSFPHFWRFFCWSRLPLWWSYTGWWLLISFNVKVSLPIPGTVPQGLGLRCFRQSPCPDFDVFEHLITHPMNVDLKWLGIGEWPQLVGGFKYTIVLCPTIEIGWTSPIMIFEIRFFFCRAAETTIKPTHKLLFTVPEPRPWSHRRSMPLQSIVQKARGWREFLVTFQRELDGEHVSQHFTHVITCYECASSHALVTFTRLYLHVSFMGFSWGKCRTRHG